jgi:integrase
MPRRTKGPYLAWVEKRECWYIRCNEHGGRAEISTGTADRREAEAALGAYLAERQHQFSDGPAPPDRVMLADVLADWLSEHGCSLADAKGVAGRVDKLLDFWGRLPASAVTGVRCGKYCAERGVADGTLRRELGILRAALNHAVREQRLTYAPFVKLPPRPQGRDRWLTRSEAAALLNAARQNREDTRRYVPLFILLGLYTGGRKSALLELKWPQVQLEQGRIDLNPPGRKRTNKGRPILPIPRRLRTFLVLAQRRSGGKGAVVSPDGRQIKNIKRAFNYAVKEAGLIDVTPHTLRHTCGTWLAQKGVPLFKISGWLGQSNARTTELYAHHSPEHLAEALAAMD